MNAFYVQVRVLDSVFKVSLATWFIPTVSFEKLHPRRNFEHDLMSGSSFVSFVDDLEYLPAFLKSLIISITR